MYIEVFDPLINLHALLYGQQMIVFAIDQKLYCCRIPFSHTHHAHALHNHAEIISFWDVELRLAIATCTATR